MKEKLNYIREPDLDVSFGASITSSFLALVFGVIMGAATAVIKFFGANSTVWWQDIISELQFDKLVSSFPIWFLLALAICVNSSRPLKAGINVLLFFIGVCAGIMAAPLVIKSMTLDEKMSRWFIITAVATALAFVFWYAKGKNWPSLIFDTLIIGLFGAWAFDCGFLYFQVGDLITDGFNALILVFIVIVLANGFLQFFGSLMLGVLLALALSPVFH